VEYDTNDNMDERNDRNAPATKGDIEDLRQEFVDFKVEVNTRFEQFEHRMEQHLSDMEGRILTSIYRLAESTQQRVTQVEGNQGAFNARLATLETRLLEVEKRLNMPPTA
jgi:predicted  nucleic acid-binding Zn-ribbon protein